MLSLSGLGSCGPGKLPEKLNVPKVVRRGCKRSFGPREQEASCTGAKWGCTSAKEGLGGAKASWETFAPWAQKSQKDLLHPPLTTFGDFPFGQFPRPTASNVRMPNPSPILDKNCAPTVQEFYPALGLGSTLTVLGNLTLDQSAAYILGLFQKKTAFCALFRGK